ncbi:MAG: SRPBCC family protein [Actinomycetota bacterium]
MARTRPRRRNRSAIAPASCTVLTPPAEVWAVLADFGRIAAWAPSVDHSEALTPGPLSAGSARRVQVGHLTLAETVVVCEPPSTLAYTLDGLPPFVARAENRWTLEPAGDRRTTVTLEAELTAGPRPPMRLATAVLRLAMGRSNRQLVDALAQHLGDSHDIPAETASPGASRSLP